MSKIHLMIGRLRRDRCLILDHLEKNGRGTGGRGLRFRRYERGNR
jgi:hypothetical protein